MYPDHHDHDGRHAHDNHHDHHDHHHDGHDSHHAHGHHAHGHQHGGHGSGPLEQISHVHGGPIVLDIGGDVGALVVLVGEERLGTELFVRSAQGRLVHTGVWRRQRPGGEVAAAVFCELAEGHYQLLGLGPDRALTIEGGHVTELDLGPR